MFETQSTPTPEYSSELLVNAIENHFLNNPQLDGNKLTLAIKGFPPRPDADNMTLEILPANEGTSVYAVRIGSSNSNVETIYKLDENGLKKREVPGHLTSTPNNPSARSVYSRAVRNRDDLLRELSMGGKRADIARQKLDNGEDVDNKEAKTLLDTILNSNDIFTF